MIGAISARRNEHETAEGAKMGFPSFEDGTSEYQEFYFPAKQPMERPLNRKTIAGLALFVSVISISAALPWISTDSQSAHTPSEASAAADIKPQVATAKQLAWATSLPTTTQSGTESLMQSEPMVMLPLKELENLQLAKLRAEVDLADQREQVVMAGRVQSSDLTEVIDTAARNAGGTEKNDEVIDDCIVELQNVASLSTIYFDSGSAELDVNGRGLLRQVAEAADRCPQASVQVSGHSDSSGSDLANLNLSWQRAEHTIAVLGGFAVDISRFEPVGFGAKLPSSQGASSDLDRDRRVEFKVLLTPIDQ